tara:strand:+ start:42 stop:251 length:210 start_codon:yes stop_codon:yes gene_type:complete
MSEIRACNVCNTKDEYENMIMDIREILECSEQRITEWENNNKNICLLDWFCDSCSTKVINEIEVNDEQT